jgi:glycosyltransferase involved in cell wall biosynthesis
MDPGRYRILIAYLHGVRVGEDLPDGTVIDLSRKGRLDPFILFRLGWLIRKVGARIVHTHLVHADLLGRWAARAAGVSTIVTTRHYGIDHKAGTRLYRMADSAARKARAVVAVSRAVAEFLVDQGIAPKGRIAILPNGIDPVRFAPAAETGGDSAHRVIGAIGRLHPQKGLLPLLEIFRAVVDRYPEARLEIVGEGPLRSSLEARIVQLGLEGRARLLGTVPYVQIPETIARWCLFVMPSRWEGFGIAAAEAMAMEKPVVASALEGLLELVEDGKSGYLLAPGATEAWCDTIVGLLRNPETRRLMGQAARQRVLRHFDIRTMVERLAALYDSLLGLTPDDEAEPS